MSKSKLDQLIEAKLKSREAESRYHKRSRLLEVKESLGKMLAANLSIKEQIEVLEEAGITLSDKSYREFLAREFGGEYDDFLKRNGWIRKKRQRENDA
ncbi:MAG: hypothetical protein AB7E49_08135 [Campylobacterales bacterium]